ncbi:MT-A70 family methyltransferase [Microbacterium laevaniformans]|uniref:MT-A70 family methyltransferase n=1 Tax=Microbacterium laevaniformans TaxID=36807 RepID=UPI00363CA4E5
MHTTNTNNHPEEPEETPAGSPPDCIRRYRTILADPPWQAGQKGKYGASTHYDLMSLERIKRMPVADLADDNAHLYLWCYPSTRYVAEDVMRAWGFEFKDEFVWGKDQMGLGQYFRHAHETLLLGVKGKLPVKFKGQRSFTMLPRQDHSHKPEEVHAMIQRLSPGPYLELFARRPTHGWDIWGIEVQPDLSIPGYPVPTDTLRGRGVDPRSEVDHA